VSGTYNVLPIQLTLRRERIVPIRILGTDAAIGSVDYPFGILVHGNGSGDCRSFLLCGSTHSGSAVACTFYLSATFGMRGYMLILTHT